MCSNLDGVSSFWHVPKFKFTFFFVIFDIERSKKVSNICAGQESGKQVPKTNDIASLFPFLNLNQSFLNYLSEIQILLYIYGIWIARGLKLDVGSVCNWKIPGI